MSIVEVGWDFIVHRPYKVGACWNRKMEKAKACVAFEKLSTIT
jgi:hypothetical protein